MRAGRNELAFLKEMVRHGDGESSRRLVARINLVEREERRSRRWLVWLGLGLLCLLAGVGLATGDRRWLVEQPEHPISQVVFWVGGAALFGLVLVLGCWLRYRGMLRGLVREARRYLAGWLSLEGSRSPIAEGARCTGRVVASRRLWGCGLMRKQGCGAAEPRAPRGRHGR